MWITKKDNILFGACLFGFHYNHYNFEGQSETLILRTYFVELTTTIHLSTIHFYQFIEQLIFSLEQAQLNWNKLHESIFFFFALGLIYLDLAKFYAGRQLATTLLIHSSWVCYKISRRRFSWRQMWLKKKLMCNLSYKNYSRDITKYNCRKQYWLFSEPFHIPKAWHWGSNQPLTSWLKTNYMFGKDWKSLTTFRKETS